MRIGMGCGALALATLVSAAQAAPLTCRQYRDRLDVALNDAALKDVGIIDYTLGFSGSRGKRFDWTANGLKGSLSCGPNEEFEEFAVSPRIASKQEFASSINRVLGVAGASICALTTDRGTPCVEVSRIMMKGGLEQLGRRYSGGSKTPSGLVDRPIFTGVQAELSIAPTIMTFTIGPGRGATTDEERKPLASVPDAAPTAGSQPKP